MFQSGTRLGKGLITVVTLVRANTSMGADVTNQRELHCEGLVTNVALVRTQTSMNATVALEIVGLSKGLATLVTFKWADTSVDELMPGQGVSVCECLSAGLTLEGLLLTVCPHMGQ